MAGTPRKSGASTAKGGKGKLILIVAATVVLLLGAGAGAYFLGFVGGGRPASAAAQKDARGVRSGLPQCVQGGPYFAMRWCISSLGSAVCS